MFLATLPHNNDKKKYEQCPFCLSLFFFGKSGAPSVTSEIRRGNLNRNSGREARISIQISGATFLGWSLLREYTQEHIDLGIPGATYLDWSLPHT